MLAQDAAILVFFEDALANLSHADRKTLADYGRGTISEASAAGALQDRRLARRSMFWAHHDCSEVYNLSGLAHALAKALVHEPKATGL